MAQFKTRTLKLVDSATSKVVADVEVFANGRQGAPKQIRVSPAGKVYGSVTGSEDPNSPQSTHAVARAIVSAARKV